MPAPIAFRLRGVTVRYGAQAALAGAELEIRPGEALALVGPSGAGKTTLLGCLNAGCRPAEGVVEADGLALATLSGAELRRLRSRIGWIPQGLGLVPNLRVAQNVLAGGVGRQGLVASLRTAILPRAEELAHAHALCASLGIGDKLFHRVDSLSGGERQRAAIARALYQEPGALLADEPLAALDPARARETLQLFVELAANRATTLVLSLHDIALARECVPRLVGLRAGRIVFDRAAADVDDATVEALYRLEDAPAPPAWEEEP